MVAVPDFGDVLRVASLMALGRLLLPFPGKQPLEQLFELRADPQEICGLKEMAPLHLLHACHIKPKVPSSLLPS